MVIIKSKVWIVCLLPLFMPGPGRAEFKEIESIGPWKLLEDKDESFGALGYQISSGTNDGRLQVTCEITKSAFTYQIAISSDGFNFSTNDVGSNVPAIVRFDSTEAVDVRWKVIGEKNSLTYFTQNMYKIEEDAYYKALNDARSSDEQFFETIRGDDSLGGLSAMSNFLWALTVHKNLAVLFRLNNSRVKLEIDVSNSREALNKFFSACSGNAYGDVSSESPPVKPDWQVDSIAPERTLWVQLRPSECLEVEVVDISKLPVEYYDYLNATEFYAEEIAGGHLVVLGPKLKLEFVNTGRSSNLDLRTRAWDAREIPCE